MSRKFEHWSHAGKRFLPRGHTRDALAIADAVGQFRTMDLTHLWVIIVHIDV